MTQTELFNHVRNMIASQYVEFEFDNTKLESILKTTTLPLYNRYFPQHATMPLDCSLAENKTDVPNEFWLKEPDNLPIQSVVDVLVGMGDYFIHQYPTDAGFRTFDQIPGWAEEVTRAKTAYLHSPMQITWEFLPPSKLRIMPIAVATNGKFTVRYTRGHKIDLSTIEVQYRTYLQDLFLAHVKIALGRHRKKYQNLQTPFGEIPVNGDDLISDGKDELNRLIELFDNKALPNVLIKVS